MNSIASLPLQSEPGMNVAVVTSVIAYESMCRSIDTCQDHAECKDIFDKAAALKEYARRIKNTEAERRASNVRLIAERRYGQLIAKLARATPAEAGKASGEARSNAPRDGDRSTPYAKALADTGVSTQAASRFQALGEVPKEIFDEAISNPVAAPTARALIAKARDPQPQMPDDSLWIWGRMRDFERDAYAAKDISELIEPMTDSMRKDITRIAPAMADFFTQLSEASK